MPSFRSPALLLRKEILFALLCSFCWAGLLACSDDSKPLLTDGGLPIGGACPPMGIGVAEHNGVSPAQQIANYTRYSCDQPQICPDLGARFVGLYIIDPGAAAAEVPVTLTNCSTGNNRVEIESVVVLGDRQCAFTDVSDAEITSKTIDPGSSEALRTTYKPTSVGDHHAVLRIKSNAANFPELLIAVCGLAQQRREDAGLPVIMDGGSAADGGGPAQDSLALVCEAPDTVNPTCHSQ